MTFSFTIMWLLIALGLLGIELITPGLFFFISFSFGALFGAFTAFVGHSLIWQCCVALGVALIQFNAMRRVLKRFSNERHTPTNIHALIGKLGYVTAVVTPQQCGRVKVGGEEWAASADETLLKETRVEIIALEGNRVVVKKRVTHQEGVGQ